MIKKIIITKKIIPATNTKGTRIKATCQRGSITIQHPFECSPGNAAHVKAADCLVAKFLEKDKAKYGINQNPWSSARISDQFASGDYVHVFIPRGFKLVEETNSNQKDKI